MTKRIKINTKEELAVGMRVEVEYRDGEKQQGVVFKPNARPQDKSLGLDFVNIVCFLYSSDNQLDANIFSIHRLIDGIEDVVVGDIVIDEDENYRRCLGKSGDVYFFSEGIKG
jgi:hypothetical protein